MAHVTGVLGLRRSKPGLLQGDCRHTDRFSQRLGAPKDHINTRILETMVSGIPLILGLGTRMPDPDVSVVLLGP